MKTQELAELRKRIAELAPRFEEETGLPPCAPVAVTLREKGWGKVGYGLAPYGLAGMMGHYFNIAEDGLIIDGTAFWYGLEAGDIEIQGTLASDELPPLYGEDMIAWWRERI